MSDFDPHVMNYYMRPSGRVHDEVRFALAASAQASQLIAEIRNNYGVPVGGFTKNSEIVSFEVGLEYGHGQHELQCFDADVAYICKAAELSGIYLTNVRACVLVEGKLEDDLPWRPKYGDGVMYVRMLHDDYYTIDYPLGGVDKRPHVAAIVYRPLTKDEEQRMLKDIDKAFGLVYPGTTKPRKRRNLERDIEILKQTNAGKRSNEIVADMYPDADDISRKQDAMRSSVIRSARRRARRKKA